MWIKDQVAELNVEAVKVEDIAFDKSSDVVPRPSLLSVLRLFAHGYEDEVRIALDIMSSYLSKRPAEAPLILRVLIEDYGFKPTSYMRGFEVQCAVVNALWKRAEKGDSLFSRVFLNVASNYLGTHFDCHSMKERGVFQTTRFDLPVTPELIILRQKIWQRLIALFALEEFKNSVLDLIHQYSTSHFRINNSEVVKNDAVYVLPFLESELAPDKYWHCIVFHAYLDLLESHGVELVADGRLRISNDTYALAKILLPERGEQRELKVFIEEYKQYKQDRLAEYTADFIFEDYTRFFDQCMEIRSFLGKHGNDYQLKWGVECVLLELADRDFDLFEKVLVYYFSLGDPLRLHGYWIVHNLVAHRGVQKALQIIAGADYSNKGRWLFHIYEALPEEAVNEERLSHLYDLFRAVKSVDLPQQLEFLLKFLHLDARVVAKAVGIMLDKMKSEPDCPFALVLMFNPSSTVAKRLADLFSEDLDLLKRAYLVVEKTHQHSDYMGEVFDSLLDLDPNFIIEYISWRFSNKVGGWLNSYDENRDYTFLWARPDYHEVMERVVNTVNDHEQNSYVSISPYLGTFFRTEKGSSEQVKEVQEKQNDFLLGIIDARNSDADFMKYMFEIIAEWLPERKLLFIRRFVQQNNSIDAFERLNLEPHSESSNGSWVPVLQKRVNFWRSLLPVMNSVDLLPHKQFIEHKIQRLLDEIEREKKNDFIGA